MYSGALIERKRQQGLASQAAICAFRLDVHALAPESAWVADVKDDADGDGFAVLHDLSMDAFDFSMSCLIAREENTQFCTLCLAELSSGCL